MAKLKAQAADPNPDALRSVDKSGKPPGHRLTSAHQSYEICDQLDRNDRKRRRKRGRIFKAYNRFPPSEYSTLYKEGLHGWSNVNFGMMAFVIDNNLSSFFDMVTERTQAATIITKFGNHKEQLEYSEYISMAFDKVIREWDEYIFNVEQDLLDMLLYSKGIEMWEEKEGCMTEHVSADDILIPEDTKVSLCNWTEIVVRRSYTLLELYEKIKDKETAKEMGWNRTAVINAMRYQREDWKKKNSDEFLKMIADGDVTFGGHNKEKVHTYIHFVREFNDKVSKYVILQDYAPCVSLTKGNQGTMKEDTWKNKIIDNEGFLYSKTDYEDSIRNVFCVFMDCSGNGIWHRIPSLGEKIFIQCRQYDFTMNAIMDAVKLNMSLMLQPTSSDSGQKIKELVFGPFVFIPAEVPFVQQRIALPTQEATGAIQFMMSDMYRGIGEYRIQEKGKGGGQMTATERQLDAAESAKLTGTQLKRYNGQFTFYFRKLFEKMVSLTKGEKDYEHLEKFIECLKEYEVPKEAWAWKNIKSIESNMLAGAGSPSYKLMAAEKTLQITNITPKDEGQSKAMEDAIAALHGRSNVGRYIPKMKPDLTFNERIAHWENTMLSDMTLSPSDVQVNPTDNHPYHTSIHFDGMEKTIKIVQDKMKANQITETFAENAAFKLLNVGAHTMAHLKLMERDPLKQQEVKDYYKRLNMIQRAADQLAQQMNEMKESRKNNIDLENDPDVKKKIALGQIEVNTKQQLSNIKIGANAASHAQRQENEQDRTANDIAMTRAKELDKINTKNKLEAQNERDKAAKEAEALV